MRSRGWPHARADQGCEIFVKLWQFAPDDRAPVHVAMAALAVETHPGTRRQVLHVDAREEVTFQAWAPRAASTLALPGGGEVLMLDGTLLAGDDVLRAQSSLRLPVGSTQWPVFIHSVTPLVTPASGRLTKAPSRTTREASH